MAPASYAMYWWFGDGSRRAGRIEVNGESVCLSATTPGGGSECIGFSELVGVVLERGLLHLERRAEPTVHIGSLDTPGALRELAEVLSGALPQSAG